MSTWNVGLILGLALLAVGCDEDKTAKPGVMDASVTRNDCEKNQYCEAGKHGDSCEAEPPPCADDGALYECNDGTWVQTGTAGAGCEDGGLFDGG